MFRNVANINNWLATKKIVRVNNINAYAYNYRVRRVGVRKRLAPGYDEER